MSKKIFAIGFIWFGVVAAYLILAAFMPGFNDIVSTTNTTMYSGNMTGIIGVGEAVNSAPMWVWFIPGVVGIVTTAITLKGN